MAENINQSVKKNQRYLWGLILLAVSIGAGAIYGINKYLKEKPAVSPTFEEDETHIEPDLTGAMVNTFDGKVGSQVMTDAQSQAKETREALTKVLKELEDIKGQLESSKQDNEDLRKQIKSQDAFLADMLQDVEMMKTQEPVIMSQSNQGIETGNTATRGRTNVANNSTQGDNYTQSGGVVKLSDVPAKTGSFERKSYAKKGNASTSRFYIPSGAFSNAIILEGADASAAVTAQTTNVAPMMFKLTGELHLPANKKMSKLKGCFVTAGTYGDISSERAIVRLERLSCLINGKHIDQPVKGHVAFYGKNGIKGTPVMRNGKILGLAFTSGALGGLGSSASQIGSTTVGIGATSTVGAGDVARQAFGAGASTAANKMADYYIQRAEQYHPVIPIGSANRVEVVFQEGFWAEFIEDIEEAEARRNGVPPENVQEQQEVAQSPKTRGIPAELQHQLGEVTKQSLSDFVTPNQK